MDNPLDRAYLDWLYDLVGPGHVNPRVFHHELLRQMHTKEFVWWVPNDDNRVEDGRSLRHRFVADHRLVSIDEGWMQEGCSFLEMLVGLSDRLSFIAEGESSEWFWHLIGNLGLKQCSDNHYKKRPLQHRNTIDDVMEAVIWRQYMPNGRGGLFPLDHPKGDQRDVEIWAQLSSYLIERDD